MNFENFLNKIFGKNKFENLEKDLQMKRPNVGKKKNYIMQV